MGRGGRGSDPRAGAGLAPAVQGRALRGEAAGVAVRPADRGPLRVGPANHLLQLPEHDHAAERPADDGARRVRAGDAAVRSMACGATTFDMLFDCEGFHAGHLDVRVLLPLTRMIQQPFRDRLRSAVIVAAPAAFGLIYNCCAQFMSEVTRRKVCFLTPEEAVEHVLGTGGRDAAEAVARTLASTRAVKECRPGCADGRSLPSELPADRDLVQRERASAGACKPSSGAHPQMPSSRLCCGRRFRSRAQVQRSALWRMLRFGRSM